MPDEYDILRVCNLSEREHRKLTKTYFSLAKNFYQLEKRLAPVLESDYFGGKLRECSMQMSKQTRFWYAKLYETYIGQHGHRHSRVDLDYLYSIEFWNLETFFPLIVRNDRRAELGHESAIDCGPYNIHLHILSPWDEDVQYVNLRTLSLMQIRHLRFGTLDQGYFDLLFHDHDARIDRAIEVSEFDQGGPRPTHISDVDGYSWGFHEYDAMNDDLGRYDLFYDSYLDGHVDEDEEGDDDDQTEDSLPSEPEAQDAIDAHLDRLGNAEAAQ